MSLPARVMKNDLLILEAKPIPIPLDQNFRVNVPAVVNTLIDFLDTAIMQQQSKVAEEQRREVFKQAFKTYIGVEENDDED